MCLHDDDSTAVATHITAYNSLRSRRATNRMNLLNCLIDITPEFRLSNCRAASSVVSKWYFGLLPECINVSLTPPTHCYGEPLQRTHYRLNVVS